VRPRGSRLFEPSISFYAAIPAMELSRTSLRCGAAILQVADNPLSEAYNGISGCGFLAADGGAADYGFSHP
jgi:hypothetical protein